MVLDHLWKRRNNFLLIASNAHQRYFNVEKQKWQTASEEQIMWTLITGTNKGIVALITVDLGSSRVPIVLSVPWAKIPANIVFSTTAQMALFHPQKFCILHFMFYVSSIWVYPTCCSQKSLPRSCSQVMSLNKSEIHHIFCSIKNRTTLMHAISRLLLRMVLSISCRCSGKTIRQLQNRIFKKRIFSQSFLVTHDHCPIAFGFIQ